jgi:2-O-methyltransferase
VSGQPQGLRVALRRAGGFLRQQADLRGLELPEKGQIRKDQIKRFLPPAPVVVEAGAHVGVDTVAMARRWKGSTVHAFEPVPALYRRLAARARRYPNVSTYALALAARSGEVLMNVSGGRSDASSSILAPLEHLRLHPDVTFDELVTVPATTLDEWAGEHGVQPDLLWLDAQGAELQILQSGAATLRRVSAVYTEVSVVHNYAGGVLYPELASWLGARGFEPVIERIAWADGGNVLFARAGHPKGAA